MNKALDRSQFMREKELGVFFWWLFLGGFSLVLGFIGSTIHAEPSKMNLIAEVNGEVITVEDLDEELGVKLAKLQEQMYVLKRRQLNAMVEQKLLAQEAARRGLTVPALLDAEVTSKVGLVTETEIETFYQTNNPRIRGEEDEVRQKIRAALQSKKISAQRKVYVDTLRLVAKVQDNLKPPPVMRVDVSPDGAPIRGVPEGSVTLVEFSDFHCPFCKRVQPTLEKVLDRYPDKVKLVFRDFPLDQLHPKARQAASAARCAGDQNKFWEYHDLLFANAPKASTKDLTAYAKQVGLNEEKFQSCLSDGVHKAAVQRDVEAGARLGITGTPMFFINGRPLSGALPFERFVQVIEEELARAPVAQKTSTEPKG